MRRETLREKDPPIYGENAVSLPRTFHEPPCSQCFVLHWHDCMELIRVRKGVLELHLDEQTTCSVLPGEVAVIAPRQAHQGIAGPSGVVYDVFMFMVADFLNAAPVANKLLSALAECTQRCRTGNAVGQRWHGVSGAFAAHALWSSGGKAAQSVR